MVKTNDHVIKVQTASGDEDWISRAHTIKLETRKPHLVDPEDPVPFPFPVPQPVPITKNDRKDNPTPQALTESEKTSVKSGGLEGKILRKSLIPKPRMRPKNTVPQASKPVQPKKPTGGGSDPSGTSRPNPGPKKVTFGSAKIKHHVSDSNRLDVGTRTSSRPSRPPVRYQAGKTKVKTKRQG